MLGLPAPCSNSSCWKEQSLLQTSGLLACGSSSTRRRSTTNRHPRIDLRMRYRDDLLSRFTSGMADSVGALGVLGDLEREGKNLGPLAFFNLLSACRSSLHFSV